MLVIDAPLTTVRKGEEKKLDDASIAGRLGLPAGAMNDRKSARVSNRVNQVRADISSSDEEADAALPLGMSTPQAINKGLPARISNRVNQVRADISDSSSDELESEMIT